MLKYYIKVAFRNILCSKAYSLINIIGLSIGIACAIIVYLYVKLEVNYDSFYPDYERIYRIVSNIKTNSMDYPRITASPPISRVLKADFPQVEMVTRYSRGGIKIPVRFQDTKVYTDRPYRIEQGFFEIFPRKIISGLTSDQVVRPNTVVLTESFAQIIFGDKNPIGKIIIRDSVQYEVTAVMENWPKNSHMQADILCSWLPSPFANTDMAWMDEEWGGQANTYVKLRKDADVNYFAKVLKNIEAKYNKEPQRDGLQREVLHYLQPINEIHLKPHSEIELEPAGNISYLRVFAAIGLLILLIACINYMNLTTAKFMKRTREIGIRKTVGATRKNLIIQFLFESFIFVFIAHTIAMFLVEFCLPYVNQLLETQLEIDYSSPQMLLSIIVLIVFTSLISGSYPAFFLSSFRPIAIIHGKIKTGFISVWVRKGLVIFQFAVSVGLIVSVMVIYKQLNYMKKYPLGFDKEQKLVIRFPRDVLSFNNYQSVKKEFLKIPQVNKSSFCSSIPGEWNYGWRTYLPGEENIRTFLMNYYQVDEDFSDVIGLEFLAGTPLLPEHLHNTIMELVINEAALKTIGWNTPEEAVGKSIWSNDRKIVGVFKDFHFKGLQENVGPMGIFQMDEDFRLLILDINTSNYREALNRIEKTYNEIMPNYPFEYFFMDENFNNQYRSEEQMGQFLTILSLLGVFIACIGLLGLASFMTHQRTKEIGIRKVNGACVIDILSLLVGSFSKWILVANIIAWPIVYYLLKRWLDNFAFQTKMSWWIFVIAGLISLFLALGTVLYQSYMASKANPVDSLKCE